MNIFTVPLEIFRCEQLTIRDELIIGDVIVARLPVWLQPQIC